MLIVRRVGLAILAVAAIAVFFGMKPDAATLGVYDALIDLAVSTAELNESRAETAPQQQVVNGWAANDFLEIIARQGTIQADSDERGAALLTIGVLAIVLWGMTTTSPYTPSPEALPLPLPEPKNVPIPVAEPGNETGAVAHPDVAPDSDEAD